MGLTIPGQWRALDVAIIGGGIGGMSAAIALRRAGHAVTVYERSDYAGEVGASVSCAANGTRWLHDWKVNIDEGDPVVLQQLINRDWKTGEPVSVYSLEDYERRWGYVYYMFHRQYMHKMLQNAALGEGEGTPANLLVNHKCQSIDMEQGIVTFANGVEAKHDLIIGADGIGSVVRGIIGITPSRKPSDQACLHCNVTTAEAREKGLVDYSIESALKYWGGQDNTWNKIVLSPCNGGELLSYYCFFSREMGDYTNQSWGAEERPVSELVDKFPNLDRQVLNHLSIGKEIQPWRLWMHERYPYVTKSMVALLGDAGHPMMPHQSQGACMAIEDAGALGLLFSKQYFRGDISEALSVYDDIRLPRASKVQASAAKAAYNINERIGFSSNKTAKVYKVQDESAKLTIEEMNAYVMEMDVEEKLAARRGEVFEKGFRDGLKPDFLERGSA
ncbi:hypothetical protein MBLNU230_g5244t1 [Neophaeotheca triangularis]